MAFPVGVASDGGNSANATSRNVALPAFTAGQLLVVVIAVDNDVATGTSFPGVWTKHWEDGIGDGFAHLIVASRTMSGNDAADGTTGSGANLPITHSSSQASSAQVYKVTGATGVLAKSHLASIAGDSNNPNPPSLTPPWGAKDTLWLAIAGRDSWHNPPTNYPSNYGSGVHTRYPDTTHGVTLNTAQRNLNAASEDQGAWLFDQVCRWGVMTLAIEPVAVAGGAQGLILT